MKNKTIAFTALFAAFTAVGAFIKIPIPFIPFTLQILSVYLAGSLLGPKIGSLSQLCYVLIGLVGLPIFTGGGGPLYVLKPTFGYLIGFVLGSYVNGWLIQRFRLTKIPSIFLANLGTLLVVYVCGCTWLYGIMKWVIEKPLSFHETLIFGFYLPAPGDVVLAAVSAVIIYKLRLRVKLIN
ncbi:biotin transporter BioY [Rummeliibacillus sp. G93]|uniref:Biotin transporter n=1 Tax=Rummeliibacillus stabekisii TaxID=241244 RepID=A0A143HES3_9BACL|nr:MULTISPECIES: biotin transporter BioY [Rummeliibacillus]AMW99976.1 biotin biosynthesis protein BioY [Rummeliibacillus stabekisii]UQW96897.1 biotin transporter BioY [Rummeliibacillus sp. G93]